MTFASFPLHPDLQRGVKELGFTRPTPIQAAAIPPALEGRDVLACAMTGSGKTAAFGLPILNKLMTRPRGTTRALILTPTRELAAQIEEHLRDLAVHTPISGAAVFGGVGMGPQEHAFRTGVDIIVATPGRLLDHLRYGYARFSQLEFLVLDEADRMLDMGFIPDVRRILKQLPAKRQTMFFSATMPQEVGALARQMLRDPIVIDQQRRSTPAVGITQAVFPVPQHLKPVLLMELLRRENMRSVLVFTRTKHRADRLSEFLRRNGEPAEVIHGDRSQSQRTKAMEGFKRGHSRVLVATDIAARGIDIIELSHVVNYDVPRSPEDYVHRVGRTGRASATGDAFTLLSTEEEELLRDIEKTIQRRLPRVTLPDFNYKQVLLVKKPNEPAVHRGSYGARHDGHRRHDGHGSHATRDRYEPHGRPQPRHPDAHERPAAHQRPERPFPKHPAPRPAEPRTHGGHDRTFAPRPQQPGPRPPGRRFGGHGKKRRGFGR